MIISFLLILIWTKSFEASHFNGGTITWAPVYPNSTSSSVLITITQSYSWVYPNVNCSTNIPLDTSWFGTGGPSNVNLTCVGNCSTQGGYSNHAVSILTDCTAYIVSLNMIRSQRSVNITLDANAYFWIAYQGSAWRTLQNAATSFFPGWSIASLINLQKRPDGLINTPPVAQITSPQYVIVNRTTTINIPVSDVNAGDDVRCRWSSQNSSYGVNECDDVCMSGNMSTIANLSDCTLTFTATKSNVWYAIALQVEDFIDTSSTDPMSSVPVQFLIDVLPAPNCSQLPIILPLSGCLEVQVNVIISLTLYVMNFCNRTATIITDLVSTVDITGMQVSDLINSTTNTSLSYVTLTWTPLTNQIGSQLFCAIAYTNEKVQSDPYCVNFTVTTSKPCTTTTTTTTSTVSTTTTSKTTTSVTTSSTSASTTVTTTITTSSTSTASTTTTSKTTTSSTSTTISTTSETTTTTTTSTTTTTTSESTTTTSTTSTTTTTTATTTTTSTQTTTTTATTSTTITTSTTTSTTSATTTTTTSTQTTTATTTSTTSTTITTTATTSTTSESTTTTTSTQTTTTTTSTTTSTTSATTTTTTATSTTSQTTTTSTSTQTTTATTSVTTTTTVTTATTTTVTTATTATTTSITTTTQTTSTVSNKNQTNLALIVGLSLLGLLLALCFCCSWLYYLKWSTAARRRRQNKAQNQTRTNFTESDQDDIAKIRSRKKLQNYLVRNELSNRDAGDHSSINNPIKTTPVSTNDNERISNVDPNKIKKSTKPRTRKNTSNKLHQNENSDERLSTMENHPLFQRSSVTVSQMKKTPTDSENTKSNASTKSSTLDQEQHEIPSTKPTNTHVIKLPRNKVSSFYESRASNISLSNDYQTKTRSNTINENINLVNNILQQQRPIRDNSIKIIQQKENLNQPTRISRNIVVTFNNDQNQQSRHTSRSTTKNDNNQRKRASSFGGITVSKVKTNDDNSKPLMHYSKSVGIPNNGKLWTNNPISVISVRKEQL